MKPFLIAALGGLVIAGFFVWRTGQGKPADPSPAPPPAHPPAVAEKEPVQPEPPGPEAAVAADTKLAIPQDRAQMEKHRREWLHWNRQTIVDAYDRVGKKDPRWDRQAHEALEAAAQMFSLELYAPFGFDVVGKPARAAMDAGCDDPMVVWLGNRFSGRSRYPATPETRQAAMALGVSRYPIARRALALAEWFAEDRPDSEAQIDSALALLAESVAVDEHNEFWEQRWFRIMYYLIRGYRKLGIAGPDAYQRVDKALAAFPELKLLRLQVRGEFWYRYGWDARTTAFAPAVSPAQFETFETCLSRAKEALDEAWRLRPDARTAGMCLDIEKGIGGDRAAMELWFQRVMKADGDQRLACWTKLDWLDPEWHGSTEEMLAFGRACAATKNWHVGIPLLACDAHFRCYSSRNPNEGREYLRSVWPEIQPIYDEYLKHRPHDDIAREKYAVICCITSHFREADAQFKEVGDRLTQWGEFPFVPLQELMRLRGRAATLAQESKP